MHCIRHRDSEHPEALNLDFQRLQTFPRSRSQNAKPKLCTQQPHGPQAPMCNSMFSPDEGGSLVGELPVCLPATCSTSPTLQDVPVDLTSSKELKA